MIRGNKNKRDIENTWTMLKYIYTELNNRKFKSIDIQQYNNIEELYVAVICRWCEAIAREGMYKEYVTIEDEELSAPKGTINIQKTISEQTLNRGKIVCSYDEFSDNVIHNQILKSALLYMLYNKDINEKMKIEIRKTLQRFNGIDELDLKRVKWRDIRFNNSNFRYKNIIEICKTMLIEDELTRKFGYTDCEKMYVLFKKQIIRYMKETYGDNEEDISVMEVPYTLDNEKEFDKLIFKQQKIIAIRGEDYALLMIVRIQNKEELRDVKLHNRRVEEAVGYVREYKSEFKIDTSAAILFINTDVTKINIQPMTMTNNSGIMVGETIIDVYDQWRYAVSKIHEVYAYFIERKRKKKKK